MIDEYGGRIEISPVMIPLSTLDDIGAYLTDKALSVIGSTIVKEIGGVPYMNPPYKSGTTI